ncbi:MAG: hypothetical protein L3J24_13340 [Xanthomonadales bacterium]|nr:hypothetical protein [Xanthomonadales bacterium]
MQLKKLVALCALFFGIYFIFSMYKENNEVLEINTSLSISMTNGDKQNILEQHKADNSVAIKKNSIASSKVKLEELTQQQLREVKHRCDQYFYNYSQGNDLLETYKKRYKKIVNLNKAPNDTQINAEIKIADKCYEYNDFQDDLNVMSFDIDQSYMQELSLVLKQQGVDTVLSLAEEDIFHNDLSIRLSALSFLQANETWVKSVNKLLGIDNLMDFSDSYGLLIAAVDFRECELGLFDCSSNGFRMLVQCRDTPQACNMSYRDLTEYSMTGYELESFEKYLFYLRTLPKP